MILGLMTRHSPKKKDMIVKKRETRIRTTGETDLRKETKVVEEKERQKKKERRVVAAGKLEARRSSVLRSRLA